MCRTDRPAVEHQRKLIGRADIVERFTLFLMLFVVAFRNLIELNGSEFDFSGGFSLPKSFGWFRGNNVLWTISYVSPQDTQSYLSPLGTQRSLASHFLRFFSLKRLWIGSSTHSSPSSITSDRRCTNVTPMYCAETLPVRALRGGEAHERCVVWWWGVCALISSYVTAFIC